MERSDITTSSFHLPSDIPTVKEIKTEINSGGKFVTSSQQFPVAYIKGIGRFCVCGCGRPILPKKKRMTSPKGLIYYANVSQRHQKWATPACRQRMLRRLNKRHDNSIRCRISLKVLPDKTPHRVLRMYFGNGKISEFPITENSKELWDYLNRLSRYRSHDLKAEPLKISA